MPTKAIPPTVSEPVYSFYKFIYYYWVFTLQPAIEGTHSDMHNSDGSQLQKLRYFCSWAPGLSCKNMDEMRLGMPCQCDGTQLVCQHVIQVLQTETYT